MAVYRYNPPMITRALKVRLINARELFLINFFKNFNICYKYPIIGLRRNQGLLTSSLRGASVASDVAIYKYASTFSVVMDRHAKQKAFCSR